MNPGVSTAPAASTTSAPALTCSAQPVPWPVVLIRSPSKTIQNPSASPSTSHLRAPCTITRVAGRLSCTITSLRTAAATDTGCAAYPAVCGRSPGCPPEPPPEGISGLLGHYLPLLPPPGGSPFVEAGQAGYRWGSWV